MKLAMGILMIGLGVGLAVIIGQRMSTDAMAVVIGVAVGVAASVPTSLLMVALLRRGRTGFQEPAPQQLPQQLPQPNFIMLSPEMFGRQMYVPQPPVIQPGQDGGLRKLRVVGDDDREQR